MSSEVTAASTAGVATRRSQIVNALSLTWLGFSAAWAVVVFATDQLAWPFAW